MASRVLRECRRILPKTTPGLPYSQGARLVPEHRYPAAPPSRTPDTRPWTRIAQLVDAGDHLGLESYLESLPPSEVARSISRLEPAAQTALLLLLGPEDAADLIEQFSDAQAAVELLEDLEAKDAAAIVDELPSNEHADPSPNSTSETRRRPCSDGGGEGGDTRRLLSYPGLPPAA